MLEISTRDLDADCFAMCTPEATYDLRKGMAGAREHSPEDFITKITCRRISLQKSPRCLRITRDSRFGWTALTSSFRAIRNSSITFR